MKKYILEDQNGNVVAEFTLWTDKVTPQQVCEVFKPEDGWKLYEQQAQSCKFDIVLQYGKKGSTTVIQNAGTIINIDRINNLSL